MAVTYANRLIPAQVIDIKAASNKRATPAVALPDRVPNPVFEDLAKALSPHMRMKDITRILNLSSTTIYKRMAEGKFPKPDGKDGPRVVWWRAETLKPYL